eukprot:gene3897-2766_t
MLEEDRVALDKMLREFEELAGLPEKEFKSKATPQLRMTHYSTVYNVVSRGTKSAKNILFVHYQTMLTNYLLRYDWHVTASDDDQFQEVCRLWDHYKMLMDWNLSTFRYFSRFYRQDLEETGVTIFMERVWRARAPAVFRVALRQLRQDRRGEAIEVPKLVTVLSIASMSQLNDVDFSYDIEFMEPFYTQMIEDYNLFLEAETQTNDSKTNGDKGRRKTALELLESLQSILAAEEKRCLLFFPSNRHEQIMFVAKDTIRKSPIVEQRILSASDGLILALQKQQMETLQMYFRVLYDEESMMFPSVLQKVMETWGAQLGAAPGLKPAQYAMAVMGLRTTVMTIVEKCFDKTPSILSAVRRGLETIFDYKVRFSSQGRGSRALGFWDCLVLHIDYNMRHQQDECMDVQNLSILSFLNQDDTQLLNALAESMLHRILFPDGSFHFQAERKLVGTLTECTGKQIPQLKSILSDLEVSNSFMSTLAHGGEAPRGVDFLSLRRSNWVMRHVEGPTQNLALPAFVLSQLDWLRQRYLAGTQFRTFKWCHLVSSAVVITKSRDGSSVELYLTAPQAVVLLCLNDRDAVTVQELLEKHKFTLDLVEAALGPLLQQEVVVLQGGSSKVGAARPELDAQTVVSCNRAFQAPKPVLRLAKRSARDTIQDEAGEGGQQASSACRSGGVDATIVKRLKKSPESHDSLLRYCDEALPFKISASFFKSRIEELIRKGHIARSSDNSFIYSYVA